LREYHSEKENKVGAGRLTTGVGNEVGLSVVESVGTFIGALLGLNEGTKVGLDVVGCKVYDVKDI